MKSFDIKTKIYFGDNALDILADLPYKKALIITDPFVVKSGMLQMITYRLNDGYTEFDVFSDVVPDPPIEKISLGVKAMILTLLSQSAAAVPLTAQNQFVNLQQEHLKKKLHLSLFLQLPVQAVKLQVLPLYLIRQMI